MLDKNKQEEIEKIIGYEFKDKELLEVSNQQDFLERVTNYSC